MIIQCFKNNRALKLFRHKILTSGSLGYDSATGPVLKECSCNKAAQVYALETTAMFDAFISCWNEKLKKPLFAQSLLH